MSERKVMYPISVRLEQELVEDLDQALDEGDFSGRSEFIKAAILCALGDIQEHGDQALDDLHDAIKDDEDEDDGNDNPGSDEEE